MLLTMSVWSQIAPHHINRTGVILSVHLSQKSAAQTQIRAEPQWTPNVLFSSKAGGTQTSTVLCFWRGGRVNMTLIMWHSQAWMEAANSSLRKLILGKDKKTTEEKTCFCLTDFSWERQEWKLIINNIYIHIWQEEYESFQITKTHVKRPSNLILSKIQLIYTNMYDFFFLIPNSSLNTSKMFGETTADHH